MTAIYGFCAVVGGALTVIMLLGVADTEADFDTDLDADMDPAGGEGIAAGAGSVIASLFSFRTLVFTLAFFGITGLVLPLTGAGGFATLVAALAVGGVVGYLNDRVVRYVRRTSGGVGTTAAEIAGRPAQVMLPIGSGRRGRVNVEIDGRTIAMVAEPYTGGEHRFDAGDTVVVVEVENGVARIAPFELE